MTPEQKAARIERAKSHVAADRLVAGQYLFNEGQTGCSVGCDFFDITGKLQGNYHAVVAEHDGTPEWLEYLRDCVFEGLPKSERSSWHVDFAETLPCVDDWEPARHRVSIAILQYVMSLRESWHPDVRDQVGAVVEQCIAYHRVPNEDARAAALAEALAARGAAVAARAAAWAAAAEGAAEAAEAAEALAAEGAAVAAMAAARAAAEALAAEGTAEGTAEAARAAAWAAAEAAEAEAEAEAKAWVEIANQVLSALKEE